MTGEERARAWVASRPYVDAPAMRRIEEAVALIREEAGRQNLIAPSTFDLMWQRHVQDSVQLVELMGAAGRWLDIGSGGGFPGVIVGMLDMVGVTCVEPRRIRAEFLRRALAARPLCSVVASRVQRIADGGFDVITARAVAPPAELIGMALHLAHSRTRWVLPAGRRAAMELDRLRAEWHGVFHVEQSLTSDDAGIIVAGRVTGRRR